MARIIDRGWAVADLRDAGRQLEEQLQYRSQIGDLASAVADDIARAN